MYLMSYTMCYVMLYGYLYSVSQRRLIQRRSQRERQIKRNKFKLRRDADDIPCSITIRSAGRASFQSAGPTTAAKARFWYREVRDQGTRYKKITAISRVQRTR